MAGRRGTRIGNLPEELLRRVWGRLDARDTAVASEVSQEFRGLSSNRMRELGDQLVQNTQRLREVCGRAGKTPAMPTDQKKRASRERKQRADGLWRDLSHRFIASPLGRISQSLAVALFEPEAREIVDYMMTTLEDARAELMLPVDIVRDHQNTPLYRQHELLWRQLLKIARPDLKDRLRHLSTLSAEGFKTALTEKREAIAEYMRSLLPFDRYQEVVERILPIVQDPSQFGREIPIDVDDGSLDMDYLLLHEHNELCRKYLQTIRNKTGTQSQIMHMLLNRPYTEILPFINTSEKQRAFFESAAYYRKYRDVSALRRYRDLVRVYTPLRNICLKVLSLYGVRENAIEALRPNQWMALKRAAEYRPFHSDPLMGHIREFLNAMRDVEYDTWIDCYTRLLKIRQQTFLQFVGTRLANRLVWPYTTIFKTRRYKALDRNPFTG